MGHDKRKAKLKEYIRGWVGHYHLANMRRFLEETYEWLRRRICMCIWKSWKQVKTRVTNLIKCSINKHKAYKWGNTRKGYWHIANSLILHIAISNEGLHRVGYVTLLGSYLEWHPKWKLPYAEGTYSGVRGRKTKVGRKLLRFPHIRFIG